MWIESSLIKGPSLVLCFNAASFNKALRNIGHKPKNHSSWLAPGKAARTHWIDNKYAIVCIDLTDSPEFIDVLGLLVHESVHIWQFFHSSIASEKPSSEFEAYSVQHIFQSLYHLFNISRPATRLQAEIENPKETDHDYD